MKKNLFLSVSMFCCLLMLLAACGENEEQADSENETNTENEVNSENETNSEEQNDSGEPSDDVVQELTFGSANDPVGLSPIETWDTVSDQPINQMYERLFEKDEDGEIVPHLATSYENPDDTTWIFELREDVTFHDGTPFNAEAVKYTFETFVAEETAAPGAHIMSFMEDIEVIDEFTVQMTTDRPNPNVLPVLANRTTSIISPEADQSQNLMQEPVGTGPYKFESWTQGDRLVMTRFDDYWGEPAHLDQITFVTVPDQSTAISMLETGDVDIIDGIEADHMARLESMQEVELLQTEGSPVYFFAFNMDKEPMNELEFRQAVAMGIDVDSYLSQLEGIGFKSNSVFGPAVLDYDESIEEFGYDYNPEEAQTIVEENNYGDHELTLYTSDRGTYRRMAETAQAQLSEIGLNVSIEMMEWGTLLDVTSDGEQDMFVLGSSNSMTGLETLYGYFHSDSLGANNRSIYEDASYDELIDEARETLDDDARQELINEAHERAIEEVFVVPMHHNVNTLAHHESVRGVDLTPESIFSFKEAYRE